MTEIVEATRYRDLPSYQRIFGIYVLLLAFKNFSCYNVRKV